MNFDPDSTQHGPVLFMIKFSNNRTGVADNVTFIASA